MEPVKPLSEEELQQIEAFARSPIYATFRKLMDSYRSGVLNELLTERDPVRIHQLQGRLTAINAMEMLPEVRAQQVAHKRSEKIRKEQQEDARKEALRKRKYG